MIPSSGRTVQVGYRENSLSRCPLEPTASAREAAPAVQTVTRTAIISCICWLMGHCGPARDCCFGSLFRLLSELFDDSTCTWKTDRALRIVNATLRDSEATSAGATFRVE